MAASSRSSLPAWPASTADAPAPPSLASAFVLPPSSASSFGQPAPHYPAWDPLAAAQFAAATTAPHQDGGDPGPDPLQQLRDDLDVNAFLDLVPSSSPMNPHPYYAQPSATAAPMYHHAPQHLAAAEPTPAPANRARRPSLPSIQHLLGTITPDPAGPPLPASTETASGYATGGRRNSLLSVRPTSPRSWSREPSVPPLSGGARRPSLPDPSASASAGGATGAGGFRQLRPRTVPFPATAAGSSRAAYAPYAYPPPVSAAPVSAAPAGGGAMSPTATLRVVSAPAAAPAAVSPDQHLHPHPMYTLAPAAEPDPPAPATSSSRAARGAAGSLRRRKSSSASSSLGLTTPAAAGKSGTRSFGTGPGRTRSAAAEPSLPHPKEMLAAVARATARRPSSAAESAGAGPVTPTPTPTPTALVHPAMAAAAHEQQQQAHEQQVQQQAIAVAAGLVPIAPHPPAEQAEPPLPTPTADPPTATVRLPSRRAPIPPASLVLYAAMDLTIGQVIFVTRRGHHQPLSESSLAGAAGTTTPAFMYFSRLSLLALANRSVVDLVHPADAAPIIALPALMRAIDNALRDGGGEGGVAQARAFAMAAGVPGRGLPVRSADVPDLAPATAEIPPDSVTLPGETDPDPDLATDASDMAGRAPGSPVWRWTVRVCDGRGGYYPARVTAYVGAGTGATVGGNTEGSWDRMYWVIKCVPAGTDPMPGARKKKKKRSTAAAAGKKQVAAVDVAQAPLVPSHPEDLAPAASAALTALGLTPDVSAWHAAAAPWGHQQGNYVVPSHDPVAAGAEWSAAVAGDHHHHQQQQFSHAGSFANYPL
ncbi:hypothetical protein H9P43_007124 [Blastocladiella emersonii ATCC 22665]|nr:hypothetical protein H9P43_007124 [Blastocladiella emersonii ATCC 22665]